VARIPRRSGIADRRQAADFIIVDRNIVTGPAYLIPERRSCAPWVGDGRCSKRSSPRYFCAPNSQAGNIGLERDAEAAGDPIDVAVEGGDLGGHQDGASPKPYSRTRSMSSCLALAGLAGERHGGIEQHTVARGKVRSR
jgi:hypothetical protein